MNLVMFVEEKAIDGVDYDWESPRTPDEWTGYLMLIGEAIHSLAETFSGY